MPEAKPVKIRKWHLPFLALLIVGTFFILRDSGRQAKPQYRTAEGETFGTFYKVTYNAAEDLSSVITDAMARVDASLSMFNDTSTISRINANLPQRNDSLFLKVYRLAMQVSEATGGAFDITVAPAVNAWGFGFKHSEDVTDQTVDSLLEITGYTKVHEENGQIIKADARIMLDCSAIAKGFGCDEVARALAAAGASDYMVEIGGEVVVKGNNARADKWNIGISKPEEGVDGNTLQTVLHVTDCAMATSGNYRNFYVRDGKKYAHTIDPKTCRPVSHSLLSATVLAADCATADAFATAFMVMGADAAQELLDRTPELQACLIAATDSGTAVIRQICLQ